MSQLTNDQKAIIYNKMLFEYQKLQEEIRLIKAENINISENDEKKIQVIESRMRRLYNDTQKLYR